MIIKYKTFNSTEEFEKWQEENPNAKVHTVLPIAKVMARFTDSNAQYIEYKVFVTYIEG